MFQKEYFPLYGPLIVILTFSIDRFFASKIRKKEVLRNWFSKCIIEPNIQNIDEFYVSTLKIFNQSFDQLLKIPKDHVNYVLILNRANAKFQVLKRSFENSTCSLLKSGSFSLTTAINSLILVLEDEYVQKLDSIISKNDVRLEFERFLNENKAQFYQQLYLALNKGKFYQ